MKAPRITRTSRRGDLAARLAASLLLAASASAARAQSDGAPPFAVPVVAVSFSSGDVRLAGAFLRPEEGGPFPAVVILHGSGPATFDEPAFRVHANAFVRGGFAVLVYDKRGSGRSTGDLDTSDYDDLAADAAAAVRFLRSRPDVDARRIGFLGRSEGGWVGPLAASRDPTIAYVILSSGSAVGPAEQTRFWTRNALRARGASEDEVSAAIRAKEALWAFDRHVAKDAAWGRSAAGQAARKEVERSLRPFARYTSAMPDEVPDPAATPEGRFRALAHMIDYDPGPALLALRAPLLAVIGARDDVVEPASTIATLERLQAGGRDVTVRTLPDVGHPLLVMTAEGPRYPDDYPEAAVRWALERVERVRAAR